MRPLILIGVAALAAAPAPALAQQPYVQLGGGVGFGAWTQRLPDRSPFAAGAVAFGLEHGAMAWRLDARVFDTDDEHLFAVGVAGGVTWRAPNPARIYVLGTAGYGFFLEEGDPANQIGVVLGLVAGRRPGFFAELRYDYLLGQFVYQSRSRHLSSAIVGVRLGALAP